MYEAISFESIGCYRMRKKLCQGFQRTCISMLRWMLVSTPSYLRFVLPGYSSLAVDVLLTSPLSCVACLRARKVTIKSYDATFLLLLYLLRCARARWVLNAGWCVCFVCCICGIPASVFTANAHLNTRVNGVWALHM